MPPLKHEVRPEICAEESKNDKIWPLRATGYRSRHILFAMMRDGTFYHPITPQAA